MKNRLKKITITFTLIALLPVAFILFELGSVNKNERIVREIYQNQLDAILYSVNQYSDDVISTWASRINTALSNGKAILFPASSLNAFRAMAVNRIAKTNAIHTIRNDSLKN